MHGDTTPWLIGLVLQRTVWHEAMVDREATAFYFRRYRAVVVQVTDRKIKTLFLICVPKLLVR